MNDSSLKTERGNMLDLLSSPALAAMPAEVAAHFGALLAEVQRIKDDHDEAQGGLTVANMEINRLRNELTASESRLHGARFALSRAINEHDLSYARIELKSLEGFLSTGEVK